MRQHISSGRCLPLANRHFNNRNVGRSDIDPISTHLARLITTSGSYSGSSSLPLATPPQIPEISATSSVPIVDIAMAENSSVLHDALEQSANGINPRHNGPGPDPSTTASMSIHDSPYQPLSDASPSLAQDTPSSETDATLSVPTDILMAEISPVHDAVLPVVSVAVPSVLRLPIPLVESNLDLPDLTTKITRSDYPLGHGGFADVWKCVMRLVPPDECNVG